MKKRIYISSCFLLSLCLLVLIGQRVWAQPPSITYAGPQVYTINMTIAPLSPGISGGTVAINGQTTIFAGSGATGSANGAGTTASFNQPLGTTVDRQGNVYVADAGTHLIRKITPQGVVSTFAGIGSAGSVNGSRLTASFNHPVGLAMDQDGNIYIADQFNNQIRKISPVGDVSTFAGSGVAGSSNGPALSATFNGPCGVAVDAVGNVFVADNNNHKIRKISVSGIVSTFAGSGTLGSADATGTTASFNQPFSLTIDPSGNIYVADRYNHRIRKITSSGVVTTLAGGTMGFANGTGATASFEYPTGIASDLSGNVYVSDYHNNRIRKVTPAGVVTTLSGTGAAGYASNMGAFSTFNYPFSMCIDAAGYLYIGELNNNLIRKVATTGFGITPLLPGGLTMNPNTGTISGTPTIANPATNYAIIAYNTVGSGTATLNLTVEGGESSPTLISSNAVRTDVIKVANVTDPTQIQTGVNAQTQISYMDGLGRPVQRISQQASPLKKDIVQIYTYDKYGRQPVQYLPYVAASGSGIVQSNAVSSQLAFYQANNDQIVNDSAPFTVTTFDNSPLERVTESTGSGSGWQTGGHGVKDQFRLSQVTDQIRIWNSSGVTGGYYAATALSVNDHTDENGNHTLTFTNKLGQVVDKRVQIGSAQFLETVFVYDDTGNLILQVSPEGVKRIYGSSPPPFDAAFMKAWASVYTYDQRGRLIAKQVPGSAPTYMVYDNYDRLVLVQDGRLRGAYGVTDKWYALKYDIVNRTVITGLYSYSAPPNPIGSTNQQRLQNYLDNLICDNSTIFSYEKRLAGTTFGYSNRSFPIIADADVLNVNFYDDYDFYSTGAPVQSYVNPATAGFSITAAANTTGLLTGSLKRIITSSNNNGGWIKQALFYDKFGNVIQKQNNNIVGQNAVDISSLALDIYSGHVIKTKTFKSLSSTTVVQQATYDLMDRSTQLLMSVNAGTDQTLASYQYNELGQMKSKRLGLVTTGLHSGSFLQTVDFRYNIRGWLTSINNATLSADAGETNSDPDDLFGMNILYNEADGTGLSNTGRYNGQVSEIKWKANDVFSVSTNPVRQRSYRYSYDAAGRMTLATYAANSGTSWNAEVGGYNESVNAYDDNGNILSLVRNTFASGGTNAVVMDNLTYSYLNGGSNQLLKVTDGAANTMGFSDGANIATEYTYDGNGNLISDANKNQIISYNDLNKVSKVAITGGGSVEYNYDASGVRLSKVVFNSSHTAISTYYYMDDFVFDAVGLKYFNMPEGRVMAGTSSFTNEFFIKDHLGNTRVTFKDNGSGVAAIVQESEYYPFGLTMKGVVVRTPVSSGSENKQLFNGGAELQDDLGFENSYSTFYREYDQALGRFNNIDPVADNYPDYSPYNFAFNDPAGRNDPKGDDPWTAPRTYGVDPNPMNWGATIAEQQRSSSERAWSSGWGSVFSQLDPATQYLIASAWNDTNPGTSSHTSRNGQGSWETVETEIHHDQNGAYYWQNSNYSGTYRASVASYNLNEVVISSRKVYMRTNTQGTKIDWGGVTNAAIGIVGGIVETTVGVAMSEIGIGAPVAYDGVSRIVFNSIKLIGHLSGNKEFADAVPGNTGSLVGKILDGNGFYNNKPGQGVLEKTLGIANDGFTLFASGTNWNSVYPSVVVGVAGLISDSYTIGTSYFNAVNNK